MKIPMMQLESMPSLPERRVLDYRVANFNLEEAAQWCSAAMQTPDPKLLVTLNPEIVVQAQTNPALQQALLNADLTVADGVGILWAAKQFGGTLSGRVPGVDLVPKILEHEGSRLRVYLLGAKPGVAERAAQAITKRYGSQIAGVQHGYFKRPDEVPSVLESIRMSKPHLLLAGLGEGQELFLHEHRAALDVSLMMGVGGTLDVLAGEVKRTPLWTRRLGLEWLYRVGSAPERWYRFPRLLKFVALVLRRSRAQS